MCYLSGSILTKLRFGHMSKTSVLSSSFLTFHYILWLWFQNLISVMFNFRANLLLSVIQGEHTYQVLLVVQALLWSQKIKQLFGQMVATSSRSGKWMTNISLFHFDKLSLGFVYVANYFLFLSNRPRSSYPPVGF